MYGAGDGRVEDRPDPKIVQPADAVVRIHDPEIVTWLAKRRLDA